ncbi:MAG TPA: glycosyltransferase family 2 protein [Longimicrobiaceae bacterium]|jgi:cellulose synthase/poly-beta-1,6-N-acetylglucosamine synthase-like glycosyltransferase
MTASWMAWALLAAPPLAVLGLAAFNVLAWPRGSAAGRVRGRVSVCVPARNEAARIERCVRAALAGAQAPDEVVVYDDGSTDGTGEIVARVAAEDPRLRVVRGGPLPAGWVGKPHACHRLAEEATGDVLVFIDADTVAGPECLARLGSLLEGMAADVVTVAPRHEVRTPGERLVVPLLHLTYLAWLPLPLVWRSRDPRFLVANGQLLAVRRRAYDAAGGWAAVRAEVVDDMAFCRGVKRSGGRVVFADGHRMATVRMYDGWRPLWEGFSKNLYEGIGGRPGALAGIVALYGGVFVLPYAALLAALAGAPALLAPAAAGVAANMALRALLTARFRQPPEGVLLHPLGVLALLAIAANSFRWSRRGAIRWRGRVYPSRAARANS